MKLEIKKTAGVLLLALALLVTMSFTTGFTADAATKTASKTAKTTTTAQKSSSSKAKKTSSKKTTKKSSSKTSKKTSSKTTKKSSKTSSKKNTSKNSSKKTTKNAVKVKYSVPASKTVTVGTTTYTLKEGKTSASLISTDSSTKTSKTLETLPMKGYNINNYCFISDYNNGKIYVSQNSANQGTTYTYDTATGTWSTFMQDGALEARVGNYFIAANPVKTPLGETEVLYKLNGTGYTKVKTLGKNCGTATAVGKYFYYVQYDADQTQGTLYRMSANGKKSETINTLSARSSDETFTITKITGKYCVFNVDGVNYQYTYKTRNISKMK
ncbi:hypothetical protein [Eubacterium sp. F2]|uniref:hypothetical protein n=1 Tax=Eubacterium sp. F2 TaxID=3381348 RepID=UPI0039082BE7